MDIAKRLRAPFLKTIYEQLLLFMVSLTIAITSVPQKRCSLQA